MKHFHPPGRSKGPTALVCPTLRIPGCCRGRWRRFGHREQLRKRAWDPICFRVPISCKKIRLHFAGILFFLWVLSQAEASSAMICSCSVFKAPEKEWMQWSSSSSCCNGYLDLEDLERHVWWLLGWYFLQVCNLCPRDVLLNWTERNSISKSDLCLEILSWLDEQGCSCWNRPSLAAAPAGGTSARILNTQNFSTQHSVARECKKPNFKAWVSGRKVFGNLGTWRDFEVDYTTSRV